MSPLRASGNDRCGSYSPGIPVFSIAAANYLVESGQNPFRAKPSFSTD
jgi:hypothetical protein